MQSATHFRSLRVTSTGNGFAFYSIKGSRRMNQRKALEAVRPSTIFYDSKCSFFSRCIIFLTMRWSSNSTIEGLFKDSLDLMTKMRFPMRKRFGHGGKH